MQRLEIHHLDVGMGDCTVIVISDRAEGAFNATILRTVVVDCGGTLVLGDDRSGEKLLEFLRERGIVTVDIFVVTHWDKDHFLGLNAILEMISTYDPKKHKVGSEHHQAFFTFGNMILYDAGEPRSFNWEKEDWNPFSLKNEKRDYQTFLPLVYKAQTRILELRPNANFGIRRRTERVWGLLDESWSLPLQTTAFINNDRDWDPDYYTEVPESTVRLKNLNQMQEGQESWDFFNPKYLLGKDLMNFHAGDELPGVKLTCLAVNRWYLVLNEDGKTMRAVKKEGGDRTNNSSIGMLLQFHDFSYWLGGDLESLVEDRLIPTLQSDLFLGREGTLSATKASHHGSHKSTSSIFLDALSPQAVFISSPSKERISKRTGALKDPSHPHPVLIERLYHHEKVDYVYMTGCSVFAPEMGLHGGVSPWTSRRKFHIAGAIHGQTLGHITLSLHKELGKPVDVNTFNVSFHDPYSFFRNVDTFQQFRASKMLDDLGNIRPFWGDMLEMDQAGDLVSKGGTKRKWELTSGEETITQTFEKKRRLE